MQNPSDAVVKVALAHLLALLVSGCAATAEPVMAPNGRQGWYIECRRNMHGCLDKAEDQCPYGYDMLDSGGRTTGAMVMGNGMVSTAWRGNMTIQCRAPAAR